MDLNYLILSSPNAQISLVVHLRTWIDLLVIIFLDTNIGGLATSNGGFGNLLRNCEAPTTRWVCDLDHARNPFHPIVRYTASPRRILGLLYFPWCTWLGVLPLVYLAWCTSLGVLVLVNLLRRTCFGELASVYWWCLGVLALHLKPLPFDHAAPIVQWIRRVKPLRWGHLSKI